jgi:hypothetical protein
VPGAGGRLSGPERDPPVVPGPHGARQPGVDDLAHCRVGERVRLAAAPHQQVAEPREGLPHRDRRAAQQRRERLHGDRVAEDRGRTEDPSVPLVQPVEPGGGDVAYARGHRRLTALRPAAGGGRSGVLRGVAGDAAAQRSEAAGQVLRQAGPA